MSPQLSTRSYADFSNVLQQRIDGRLALAPKDVNLMCSLEEPPGNLAEDVQHDDGKDETDSQNEDNNGVAVLENSRVERQQGGAR